MIFLRTDTTTTQGLPIILEEIEPSLPPILDAFYAHLQTQPSMRAKLSGKNVDGLKSAQTNLLAPNATIEAARAGQAGMGIAAAELAIQSEGLSTTGEQFLIRIRSDEGGGDRATSEAA